ncbi:melanocyte-stimulating hormone receptor-like [Stylophora pistillata]|uniref:melanocyte-stimulating hormone receptor-like n=1 Tax=Stylophora pistillata TaxID=50429 RepID=UPI000C042741|nr:melanocyte-stimulating hormone receptor-like [Stylophora pistillata]
MLETNNSTDGEIQMKTYQELVCSSYFIGGLQKQSIHLAVVNMILSLTAFLGYSLILVALHKESSLHPPSKLLYSCLAITDLLVGLITQPLYAIHRMSTAFEHWNLCRYTGGAVSVTSYALCGVSFLTMTAISVDRLLALLLGLSYKQIVTLKRSYIFLAVVWVSSGAVALCYILDHPISLWYMYFMTPSCLVILLVSYSKIFRTLSHHQAQVQDNVQQQASQTNTLNIARYRKALHSALWVLSALVVCSTPSYLLEIVKNRKKTFSSDLVVIREIALTLLYFNSTLNPFLYCWKIREVRQAVQQTIRRVLCCPWS